jgi:hypothetical protein
MKPHEIARCVIDEIEPWKECGPITLSAIEKFLDHWPDLRHRLSDEAASRRILRADNKDPLGD